MSSIPSAEQQFLGMIFVMFLLAFTAPSAFPPSTGAPNPISDLAASLNVNLLNNVAAQSGATSDANADHVRQQTAQNVGCFSSVVGGAAIGAAGFLAGGVPGLITTPIGAGVGFVIGCLIPSSGQTVGNAVIGVANASGLGDFTRGILTILNVAGAFLKFGPNFLLYTASLFATNQTAAVFLISFQAYFIVLLVLNVIKIVRGNAVVG